MFESSAITEIEHPIDGLYAFRVTGRVERDDMKAMSNYMLDKFQQHYEVDMAIVIDTDQAASKDASLTPEAMAAQARSLSNVRNYVIAGASERASSFINTVGKILPVEAKTFLTEAEAFAWLGAQPRPH